MKKVIVLLSVFATASAVTASAELTQTSPSYTVEFDGLDVFDCEGDTKWEQLPNGGGLMSSQDDVVYPFTSDLADDFAGDGEDLTGVGWWGGYWNGTAVPPDAFNVRVFADNGGMPGDMIYEHQTADYNETVGSPNGYCTNMPAFNKADGATYWLSVQAVLVFPPQWGWASGDGNGVGVWQRFPLLGFEDWTSSEVAFGDVRDASFVLYNEDGVLPVEEKTWSSVKNLYR
jgi:hypothetical protein